MTSSSSLSHHASQSGQVRLCPGCELLLMRLQLTKPTALIAPVVARYFIVAVALLSGDLALAVTCLLLFIPSHFFSYIDIRLFGVMIPATLPQGVFALWDEGYIALALLVLFVARLRHWFYV